jgi:hypothetical protein
MQPCILFNKITNYLFCEQVKSTLNTQISLKDHNDITQVIEYFNAIIQQAAWNSTLSSDSEEYHISISIKIREKLKRKRNLKK